MGFRVYDKKKRRWITDKVYMTPDGGLYKLGQSILGWSKPVYISEDRYVFHNAIDLYDRNGKEIYVGDYLRAQVADNREVVGLVTFASELSAYVILCFESDEYFTLGSEICKYIEVVGNVFDEYYKDEYDGQQTLQE